MWPFIRRLFTDESIFERSLRALVGAAGVGIASAGGEIPSSKGQWLAMLLSGGALFVGAGDKNKKE